MDAVNKIFTLAVIGAAIAIFVLIISASQRHRGKSSRGPSDGGFWAGIFGGSDSSDSGSDHHSHHGHHHDAGGSHHGGFDAGGHHGGSDGGGHH